MNSPEPIRREESGERPPGDSFYRYLCIWFFYRGNRWTGTASELLDELKAGAATGLFKFESWPETPKDVREYLEQYREQLTAAGLDVRFKVDSGLRMIRISWIDGIRRPPPIAVASNIRTTLRYFQNGEHEPETFSSVPMPSSEKIEAPAESDALKPESSSAGDSDQCERYRNISDRFRIDEEGRRRRRLVKLALASVLAVLVFAMLVWAQRQWREASLDTPTSVTGREIVESLDAASLSEAQTLYQV